ncbi:MAG: hypothetical protein HZA48_12230 [Planctomycetes bacterium]|nr:hypothetical protein [Planctomycetota bacterium]
MRKNLLIIMMVLVPGLAVLSAVYYFRLEKTSAQIAPSQGVTPSRTIKNPVENIVETRDRVSLPHSPVKAIDELSKSKSAEEMSKVKELNNTALNPNANIETRKKAVDQLSQLEFVETRDRVSLLLDDLMELKKSGFQDKKNSEIIGYITVSLSELYKETNKPAGAKNANQPVAAVNPGSEQPVSLENPPSVALPDAEIIAGASADDPAQEYTATEAATQKSLSELANLEMNVVNSVDKLTAVLFDKNQSQAIKLLGLKKLTELDAKVSLPVFETLLSADAEVSDDVVKVTAIKAVYDMNTAEAMSLLEKTAQSSGNARVKETIELLIKK